MTTNFEAPQETVETPVEATEEVVVEKEPEPVKQPVELKKPEPYIRPAVALPQKEISRRPRNVPRYR